MQLVNDPQADLLEHWSAMPRVAFGQYNELLRNAEASFHRVATRVTDCALASGCARHGCLF